MPREASDMQQPLQKDAGEPLAAETEQDCRDAEKTDDLKCTEPTGATEAVAQAAAQNRTLVIGSGGTEPSAAETAAAGQRNILPRLPPLEGVAAAHKAGAVADVINPGKVQFVPSDSASSSDAMSSSHPFGAGDGAFDDRDAGARRAEGDTGHPSRQESELLLGGKTSDGGALSGSAGGDLTTPSQTETHFGSEASKNAPTSRRNRRTLSGKANRAWTWFVKQWDDEDRNCCFELRTLLLRRKAIHSSLSVHPVEAERYRDQLLAYPVWKQVWTVLFNLMFGVLNPGSPQRIAWDVTMIISLFYIAAMVPVYIAFGASPTDIAAWLWYLDKVIDCFFVVDIAVNFRTGYTDMQGKVVRSRRKICASYASTWFVLDVLSSIPFDWFLGDEAGASSIRLVKTSKLSKLIKILRILRLMKLVRVIKLSTSSSTGGFDSVLDKNILKTAAFFVGGAFVAHFMGCINYWAATMIDGEDEEFPGWTIDLRGEHPDGTWDISDKYIASLYWSFSTITTVGYGDVVPSNKWERIVAIMSMVVGVTAFGYFMGSMTSMVQAWNESKQENSKRIEALEKFLKGRAIPPQLGRRVQQYYQFIWDRKLQQEEQAWLDGLSGSMRTETVLFLYQKVIRRVPFFAGKSPHFIAAMVVDLQPEAYTVSDVVMREGEPSDCMYFLARGCLHACLRVEIGQAEDLLAGKTQEQSIGPLISPEMKRLRVKAKGSFVTGVLSLRQKLDAAKSTTNGPSSMFGVARHKIMATMPTIVSRPSRMVMPTYGSENDGECEDGQSGEDLPADAEVVYVIPDDTYNKEGSGDDMHTHFAMSRHAKRVFNIDELHEEMDVHGHAAHGYYRTQSLQPGCHFGEYSCLNRIPIGITTVAAQDVEVFRLRRSALESILSNWPDISHDFRSAGWGNSGSWNVNYQS